AGWEPAADLQVAPDELQSNNRAAGESAAGSRHTLAERGPRAAIPTGEIVDRNRAGVRERAPRVKLSVVPQEDIHELGECGVVIADPVAERRPIRAVPFRDVGDGDAAAIGERAAHVKIRSVS